MVPPAAAAVVTPAPADGDGGAMVPGEIGGVRVAAVTAGKAVAPGWAPPAVTLGAAVFNLLALFAVRQLQKERRQARPEGEQ